VHLNELMAREGLGCFEKEPACTEVSDSARSRAVLADHGEGGGHIDLGSMMPSTFHPLESS
jgi:hypothetical protein